MNEGSQLSENCRLAIELNRMAWVQRWMWVDISPSSTPTDIKRGSGGVMVICSPRLCDPDESQRNTRQKAILQVIYWRRIVSYMPPRYDDEHAILR